MPFVKILLSNIITFFLRIYFYTWFIVLFVSVLREVSVYCYLSNETSENSPYQSGLCYNDSKSCSHQFRDANVSWTSCNMTFHTKLSPVCASEELLAGERDPDESVASVRLEAYIYRLDGNLNSGPAINVTFHSINWQRILMRFIETRSPTPSLCREFDLETRSISGELASSSTTLSAMTPTSSFHYSTTSSSSEFELFFDCLWSTSLEQKVYHFEYRAFTAFQPETSFTYRYLFQVPIADNIDIRTPLRNWTVFLVVDVSEMPEKLTLRLQVAPPRLDIKAYKVEVLKKLKDNSWVVKSAILVPEPGQRELRFPYDTKSKFGNYVFQVTPLHENCTSKSPCTVSSSPHILIVEMAEPKFLTVVVTIVILIPILLMGYLIWRRKFDTEPKIPIEPSGPPKLLLMYSPVSVKHVQTMIELAKYFSKTCGLVALIDELGIPETVSKDPLKWYINAFNEADYVAIFASPDSSPSDREAVRKFSRYQHIEAIAKNQLYNRLCSTETKCKFFSIALPGSNWENLPPEAVALKRYKLPLDLDPLLMLIGVSPQCDRGVGFREALELAAQKAVALQPPSLPPPLLQPSRPTGQQSSDSVSPILEEENEDLNSPGCCDTLSLSDLQLQSSQPYLSDTDSAASIDQLSLLVYVTDTETEPTWRGKHP